MMFDKYGLPIKDVNDKTERSGVVWSVLLTVLVIVFVASMVGVLANSTPKTFADFLTMLQTFPTVSTDWLRYVQISLELPSWLDWLQPFLTLVNGFVSVLGFFVTGIVQAIAFVLHFVQWVFI